VKAFISTDEWYPWFELEDTDNVHFDCEVHISEEEFKKLKEMRQVVTAYHEILKGLHREWKDD
jgi:hypothetical protein